MKRFVMLGLAALFASSSASAQVLLNDRFNTENAGNSFLNYTGFANWNVVGQVDLVKSGDFGITCAGGSGSCVDLDGSSGPGAMTSKQAFTFNSGDVVRILFDLSGSQRSSAMDDFSFFLQFSNVATLSSFTGLGLYSVIGTGSGSTAFFAINESIDGTDGFHTRGVDITFGSAGSFTMGFMTSSEDNIGPILDNVSVERNPVVTPEPSTWAMLAFGMGAVGFVSRRRSRNA